MKILLCIVVGLLVVISAYFIGLSASSRKQPDLGMVNNQLRECPATPNCVSSEQLDAGAYVEPLMIATTVNDAWSVVSDRAWKSAKRAIIENGGEIVTECEGYLHALFVTPLMRYIDDVELRLDERRQVIHIRSASRVGRSDFGVNRVRVTHIRKAFLRGSEKGES